MPITSAVIFLSNEPGVRAHDAARYATANVQKWTRFAKMVRKGILASLYCKEKTSSTIVRMS